MAEIVDAIKGAVVGKIDNYDVNRPGAGERVGYTLFSAVGRALFELTLWSKLLRGDQLKEVTSDENRAETTHGLARIAASYGRDNNLKALDLQVKADRLIAQNDRIIELLEGRK